MLEDNIFKIEYSWVTHGAESLKNIEDMPIDKVRFILLRVRPQQKLASFFRADGKSAHALTDMKIIGIGEKDAV